MPKALSITKKAIDPHDLLQDRGRGHWVNNGILHRPSMYLCRSIDILQRKVIIYHFQ